MPAKTRSRKKAPKAPASAVEELAPVTKSPARPPTQTSQPEKQHSKRKRSPSSEHSSETPSSSAPPRKYHMIEGSLEHVLLPMREGIIESHLNIYEQAVQAVLEDSQRFGEISDELDVAAIAAPIAMSLDAHFRILLEQKVDSVYKELDRLKARSASTDQMNRRLIRQNFALTKKLGKQHGLYFDDDSLVSISSSDDGDSSDDSNDSSDGSDRN